MISNCILFFVSHTSTKQEEKEQKFAPFPFHLIRKRNNNFPKIIQAVKYPLLKTVYVSHRMQTIRIENKITLKQESSKLGGMKFLWGMMKCSGIH
jgi:hypothetical protein